jgi:hypothetical protein
VESAGVDGAAAWAALSLGVADVAAVTPLSADRVAVSARRSPPQAASSTTAVSVTDSVLVIVVVSLWWGRSRPVFSRYPKIGTVRLRTS